ncbi:dihydroorotate dehydrogenase electron transfer subunit [Gorillibacterium timonense]|uniref:dihydroorotate dehydrogenase electron transfer subunit n=1 Tax=Gorillibacterium timonense TaxID=1689269 RepID=UPI00071CCB52|nr:dihydroorotate dehydrogenase electron transfer subunit [Gorillibacterium timonense]
MAVVRSNIRLASDVYVLEAEGRFDGEMGQFYMLRGWDSYPLLSRPISIHDVRPDSISFLYRIAGYGTERLSRLKPGDEIGLEGPFGNGFPKVEGRVALVGGGMGTAPLYYAARQLENPDVYLGFSSEAFGVDRFEQVARSVKVNVGGYIVEDIDPAGYDAVFTCGPLPMMRALSSKMEGTGVPLYVSLEKRMACGIGACLVCSCATKNGNRKVCADGPVFRAEEVELNDEFHIH